MSSQTKMIKIETAYTGDNYTLEINRYLEHGTELRRKKKYGKISRSSSNRLDTVMNSPQCNNRVMIGANWFAVYGHWKGIPND